MSTFIRANNKSNNKKSVQIGSREKNIAEQHHAVAQNEASCKKIDDVAGLDK